MHRQWTYQGGEMKQAQLTNLKTILILSARGYSYEEISKFLNCETKAVQQILNRGYKKTETNNLTELLVWALRENLFTLEEI